VASNGVNVRVHDVPGRAGRVEDDGLTRKESAAHWVRISEMVWLGAAPGCRVLVATRRCPLLIQRDTHASEKDAHLWLSRQSRLARGGAGTLTILADRAPTRLVPQDASCSELSCCWSEAGTIAGETASDVFRGGAERSLHTRTRTSDQTKAALPDSPSRGSDGRHRAGRITGRYVTCDRASGGNPRAALRIDVVGSELGLLWCATRLCRSSRGSRHRHSSRNWDSWRKGRTA